MKTWLAYLFGVWITCGYAGEASFTVPLIDPGTGTLYVEGKWGNLDTVTLLVDTGSSYSTIDRNMLETLQQQGEVEYLKSQSGVLADGRKITVPLYRIQRLTIGKHCLLHDVEVAIFPQNRRKILGLNALSRLSPFAISLDPPRLSLAGCTSNTTGG